MVHAADQSCSEPCALCLLHDARRSLGQPSLARFLRLIAGSATGTESADVIALLCKLFDAFRAVEIAAGRSVPIGAIVPS